MSDIFFSFSRRGYKEPDTGVAYFLLLLRAGYQTALFPCAGTPFFGSIYCFSHAFHAVCCRKCVEMYARHPVFYQVLALCRAPFHTKLAYFVVTFAFLYFDG